MLHLETAVARENTNIYLQSVKSITHAVKKLTSSENLLSFPFNSQRGSTRLIDEPDLDHFIEQVRWFEQALRTRLQQVN